jgi:hypothetical protein
VFGGAGGEGVSLAAFASGEEIRRRPTQAIPPKMDFRLPVMVWALRSNQPM